MEFTDERVVPELFDSDRNLLYWHLSRYRFAMGYINRQDRVLDVACGTGYGAYEMASLARSVVGVDIDRKTIDYCVSRYATGNLQFHCGNCIDVADVAGNGFTVCTSFETIEHLKKEDQPRFLSAICDILSDEGLCIISTPNIKVYNKDNKPEFNPYHLHELTKDQFAELLGKHFHQVHLFGQRASRGPVLKVPFYGMLNWLKSLSEGRFRLRLEMKNFLELKDFEFSTFGLDDSLILVAVCRGPRKRR